MLIAAAVCPHPPLLLSEVTGAYGPGVSELGRLRTACRAAVAVLIGEAPDLLVVVGGAGRTAEYPPAAVASLRDFAVPFPPASPASPASPANPANPANPVLPLSLTIAKWLLAGAGALPIPSPPAAWWAVASDATTADCLSLGEKLAALAPRVALLAMGDGPGVRARGVPGAGHPGADRYDGQVTAALAAADPGALAALGDPPELFAAGRAAWQVLAGAASRAGARAAFQADLRYAAAPFEVSYYVATWRLKAH